jgi:hypothetical protein
VPYQQLRPEHVIGVPPGVKLCHPSNLSNDQLETIYNNIAHIKFIGKFSTYCYSVGFLKRALSSGNETSAQDVYSTSCDCHDIASFWHGNTSTAHTQQ